MDFIAGVNRLLRINKVIRGDDDAITTFADTQHAADLQIAQIAIQEEIAEIISERLIPYEHTTGTINLVSGTRSYALSTDFIRFFGVPSFYDSARNIRIYEQKGGEQGLMNVDYLYKTNTGTPMTFYYDNTTSKKVAFYNVPDANYGSTVLTYDYEKSVMVSLTSDTLPFLNDEESFSFISMAARRFKFMIDDKDLGLLTQDSTYNNAKSRLYALIRTSDPKSSYGKRYK